MDATDIESEAVAGVEQALAFSRVPLGRWPTPIEPHDTPAGPVLVKRDDLSGFGRGGAKARKIEGLLGHMVERDHDQLITVAGNISNLVFDLLPALDRFGIEARLFIVDDPPASPDDREQIYSSVRSRVELLGAQRTEAALRAAAEHRRATARGGRPLLVLPGVSHPVAVLANASGFVEMARQRLQGGDLLPRTVFVSVATGTTLAGFLLGAELLARAGLPTVRVIGVQVHPGPIRQLTRVLLRSAYRRLGLRPPRGGIEIDRSALSGGFGRYPDHLERLCTRVEADAGLRIDPIFGAKAWWVMEQMRANRLVREPCLYWHCGFTPEWRSLSHAINGG